MFNLPDQLSHQFNAELDKQQHPERLKHFYRKWLRFYWDFCNKYHHDPFHVSSLPLFLDKLAQKNQSVQQQEEAQQAISLFYQIQTQRNAKTNHLKTPLPQPYFERSQSTLESDSSSTTLNNDNSHSPPPSSPISFDEKTEQTQPDHHSLQSVITENHSGCSWIDVFEGLAREIKLRHYSPKTLKSYRGWVRRFQTFTQSKDYQSLSQQNVVAFLSDLAVEKKVSASSQNQAFNALLFLFRNVLDKEFGEIKGVARAKRKPYIPVVLSREEIELIFDHLEEPIDLIAKLLYGCGLRLFECLNLRVHCFNFDAGILTVHNGKGQKDRTVPLPESLVPALRKQLQKIADLHVADLKTNYAGVFLPDQLGKKYKNAAKEFIWQWFFPQLSLTLVAKTQERKRYHFHESVVQKAIKRAVNEAKITKRATAHTFRHYLPYWTMSSNQMTTTFMHG